MPRTITIDKVRARGGTIIVRSGDKEQEFSRDDLKQFIDFIDDNWEEKIALGLVLMRVKAKNPTFTNAQLLQALEGMFITLDPTITGIVRIP